MSDPYRRERIEGWVGDYVGSTAFRQNRPLVREYAPEVLTAFLEAACAPRDVGPGEIEEPDLHAGLVEGVGRLQIPASVRADLPALCAHFLEDLESEGRLADGHTLGLYVLALKPVFLERTADAPKPYVTPGAPLGRNDPCPCGSGLKYKKCCMDRLGA